MTIPLLYVVMFLNLAHQTKVPQLVLTILDEYILRLDVQV